MLKEIEGRLFSRSACIILSAVMIAATLSGTSWADESNTQFNWPLPQRECRPWTYWWWMGSAVEKKEITRELETFHEAGLGGVHIIPIYGAIGYENRYIRYLSPEWMEMLDYTVSEAKRLDMGVDMTSGTGWPFGGGWIDSENASAKVLFETWELPGGKSLDHGVVSSDEIHGKDARFNALMAFSQEGDTLDLTARVNRTGKLDWIAPPGNWKLYAVFLGRTGQQVKRAAPGAEGNVIDYFSRPAINRYLSRFDETFNSTSQDSMVRAFYHDSYEVDEADWTERLFDQFYTRRGYDLKRFLPALLGEGPDPEMIARVRCDYRETIADLILEEFTVPWVSWCRGKGALTRNQAHGSPGNLLDLYAAADIPETEIFGPGEFHIPGLRVEQNLSKDYGRTNPLAIKFSSSAAHVGGRSLVSSETGTWLAEHFQVALSQVKPEIDQLFICGINHIFFHGITYSPSELPWPGWLFYASTNFGPSGSIWESLPELNAYITRCQSFLQAGSPDNDVLLYYPLPDLWQKGNGATGFDPEKGNLLLYCSLYETRSWLPDTTLSFLRAASEMQAQGYSFDYISDRLLEDVTAGRKGLAAGGRLYRVLVVPRCTYIPLPTMQRLTELARNGATVIFLGQMPSDVPGLSDLENRRLLLEKLLEGIKPERTVDQETAKAAVGQGTILVGSNLRRLLDIAQIPREPAADHGLEFIRRSVEEGKIYFLANPGPHTVGEWIALSGKEKSAAFFDPLNGKCGRAATREGQRGETEVFIQLEPGQSLILRTSFPLLPGGADWSYLNEGEENIRLNGPWKMRFTKGGPHLPRSTTIDSLVSWTEINAEETRSFAGTARYETSFELPSNAASMWRLDLGQVFESARVWINGQYCGNLWCHPFRIDIEDSLREGRNTLEIEVTNLTANRIADLDRRGVVWRLFHDINFVNIRYEPFDASRWPLMPSGLLGPVILTPLNNETGLFR